MKSVKPTVDVREFGRWGHRLDVTTTLRAALAYVRGLDVDKDARGCTVQLPTGTGLVGDTLVINRCVHLRGAGGSGDFQPTALEFPPGKTAVVFQARSDGGGRADGSVLESVRLVAGGKQAPPFQGDPLDPLPDPEDPLLRKRGHGVVIRCPFVELFRVCVENFLDGIHVVSADVEPNCNFFAVDRCLSARNARHGLFAAGTNSNVGNVTRSLFNNNGWHGVCERGFLGNLYLGNHLMENGREPFYVGHSPGQKGSVNRSILVGNYSERGKLASHAEFPALVLGGNEHFDKTSTASFIDPPYYGVRQIEVHGRVLRPLARWVRPRDAAPNTPSPVNLADVRDGVVVDVTHGAAGLALRDPAQEPDGAEFVVACEGTSALPLTVSVLNGGRKIYDRRPRESLRLAAGDTVTLRAVAGVWRVVSKC